MQVEYPHDVQFEAIFTYKSLEATLYAFKCDHASTKVDRMVNVYMKGEEAALAVQLFNRFPPKLLLGTPWPFNRLSSADRSKIRRTGNGHKFKVSMRCTLATQKTRSTNNNFTVREPKYYEISQAWLED